MSRSSKIRILCFTDANSGRDVEMILPVRYFAERFLLCEFVHAISFDPYQVYRIKPDIILTPNVTGSNLYYRIALAAADQGIPLFSLVSEGNFRTDGSYDYWGYNAGREFLQEYVCCWSERTREFLAEREPASREKIVCTGNPGCDRFLIYDHIEREVFLKKYNLPTYRKIIGYAGWTFNKLRYPRGLRELIEFYGDDPSFLRWMEEQRKLVQKILHDVIRANGDTLFILKGHPQDAPSELPRQAVNEMQGLEQFRNVLCVREEETLLDLVGVCDLWTCFESTTAIEAWLMKKPTVFLNPDPDFKRADLVQGSAVARDAAEFQAMIDEVRTTGRIREFSSEDKASLRARLLEESVGHGDGLNHIRASYYLNRVIEGLKDRPGPRYRFSLRELFFHLFTTVGGTFYVYSLYRHLYKLKKHLWVFENHRMKELDLLYDRYSRFMETFYRIHRIEDRFHAGTLFDSMFGG
jgi:surface carbohydrate biosynthesis protein